MDDIVAVVPVRAGSRRLKNKNVAPFGGYTLLEYKLRQLKDVERIKRIVVSSDSDAMLEMALRLGASTHKRGPEYCDEKTKTFGEVVAHICKNVSGEHILWACCTSPLVFPDLYEKAFDAYFEALRMGYDSLAAVEPFKRYMWDDKGPLNYKLGVEHVPSQQLPTYYFITDGILLAPRVKMIKWQYFHGPNPYKFPLPKKSCVDVDDVLDLYRARAWLDVENQSLDDMPQ